MHRQPKARLSAGRGWTSLLGGARSRPDAAPRQQLAQLKVTPSVSPRTHT
jgi:hypothetical protein